MKEHSLGKKRLAPKISGRNGIKELRLVRIEHPARRDTKEKHRNKRTDDHNSREIAKTKEHYSQFKESFIGDESSLPLMSVFDMDIVIPPSDVKFGENLCSLEFINKIRDEWERVCIVNHVFIDIAIVLTRADTTILLFNEEEGGCLWGI